MLGFMLTLLVVQVGQEVDGVRPCISLLFQHDFRFQSEREQTRVRNTLPASGIDIACAAASRHATKPSWAAGTNDGERYTWYTSSKNEKPRRVIGTSSSERSRKPTRSPRLQLAVVARAGSTGRVLPLQKPDRCPMGRGFRGAASVQLGLLLCRVQPAAVR